MTLTVLLGGARSGKSALALELAAADGAAVTLIATAEPVDEEFAARIERHRHERPAGWRTIEEPVAIDAAFEQVAKDEVVILDCLTLWVANLLALGQPEDAAVGRAHRIAEQAATRPGLSVVVSNEVGSGIVPAAASTRAYRDALGRVNAAFATRADAAFLVVAGLVLPLVALEVAAPSHADQRDE